MFCIDVLLVMPFFNQLNDHTEHHYGRGGGCTCCFSLHPGPESGGTGLHEGCHGSICLGFFVGFPGNRGEGDFRSDPPNSTRPQPGLRQILGSCSCFILACDASRVGDKDVFSVAAFGLPAGGQPKNCWPQPGVSEKYPGGTRGIL